MTFPVDALLREPIRLLANLSGNNDLFLVRHQEELL